jgi:AraC family transcriptional regulator of adaptative response/methylated-DNA-[protein]-cysteine methyltransferase
MTHELVRYAVGDHRLGLMLIAASPRGLCAVLIGDTLAPLLADLQRRFPKAGPGLLPVLAGLNAWFERPGEVELPWALDARGTPFQQQVWQALLTIPVGETRSYVALAEAMGMPTASRALAQACGANPLALIIPCHRVVRRDGGLSGYRWGVARKAALLRREAEAASAGLLRAA